MSEFDFEIKYTKGNLHCDIDCLSRAPVDDAIDSYFDERVYLITPFDRGSWISAYNDDESRNLFQKAFERQDDFSLVDDVIHKAGKLFVPQAHRNELIRTTHESHFNAHPGAAATRAKLGQNYWWPKMVKDVADFTAKCITCLKQKPNRVPPAGRMHSFEIYEPGELVAIDLIEKITESLNGNAYVIVAIDMFTRFVDAKAVPDKGAPTFTQFMLEYCGRWGSRRSSSPMARRRFAMSLLGR